MRRKPLSTSEKERYKELRALKETVFGKKVKVKKEVVNDDTVVPELTEIQEIQLL